MTVRLETDSFPVRSIRLLLRVLTGNSESLASRLQITLHPCKQTLSWNYNALNIPYEAGDVSEFVSYCALKVLET